MSDTENITESALDPNVEITEEVIVEEVKPEKEDKPKSTREVLEEKYEQLAKDTKEEKDIEVKKAKEQTKEKETQSKDSTKTTSSSPQKIDAPISWSNEDKQLFNSLPLETQKRISERESKREKIWQKIQTDQANFNKRYGEVAEAINPYMQDWARKGISPKQAVEYLLANEAYRTQNPVAYIKEFMGAAGITPDHLASSHTEQGSVDPKVAQLEQQIAQLTGYLSEQQTTQYEQHRNVMREGIESFANETDTSGSALRPHFEELYTQGYITPIVQALASAHPEMSSYDVLEKAYHSAVAAHPELSKKAMEEQVAKRIKEMNEKAQKAKVAASSIKGSPIGATVVQPNKSFRSVLEEKYDELFGADA